MAYTPEPIPNAADLREYISRELLRISAEFDQISEGVYIPVRGRVPAKTREGMLAIADGTGWNPGSGKGLYEFRNGVWSKL